MSVGTVHGRVASRSGDFHSGWMLIDKFTVSATTEINCVWKGYDDVSQVKIEFRAMQTATIYGPSLQVTLSTDGGLTYNTGANTYFYMSGFIPQGAGTELFRPAAGVGNAFIWSVGTATAANIAGATGGTSYPDGWDATLEVTKTLGGGSSVPVKFQTQWPATSTTGMQVMHGNGMFLINTPIQALKFTGGGTFTLQSGNVEIWGFKSRDRGNPV